MKKTIFYTLSFLLSCSTLSSFKSPKDIILLPIDLTKSKIEWVARKVGGKHNGFISIASGSVETDGKILTGGTIVVDATTMTDADLKYKKPNAWLMGHLKNNFFQVSKFPKASFVITSVKQEGNNFEITGKMTIKDITQEIKFPANITVTPTGMNATATFNLDRRNFGIDYGFGLIKYLADKPIYHEFNLKITLVAGK